MTVTVEKYVWGDGEVALKLIDYGYKFLDISTERGDLQIFIESLISISKDMLKISGSGELAIAIIKKGSDIYLSLIHI